MLTRLTRLTMARRRLVLAAAALFLAVAGLLGGGVAGELSGGGFDDPDAESTRASRVLLEQFGTGEPNLVLLVSAPGGVAEPAAVGSATELVERLAAEPGVTQVTSWWTSGRPDGLRSDDGTKAAVLARIVGGEDDAVARAEELREAYAQPYEGLEVSVGGLAATFAEIGTTIEHDLIRAEAIAIPITMLLLVLVFGSAVAATLPLLVGVLSILGTFLTLHLLVQVTDVSVYSVNLATALGLGLGIDYALFMVTRHREELAAGRSVSEAVLTTVRTAGRTVLFSALTVLLSLSALLVFPLYFLRSFAYAGIAAVVFAALGALVVLPAALAGLGSRIDRLDLRRPLRRLLRLPEPRPASLDTGFWSRIAHAVMRRPWPMARPWCCCSCSRQRPSARCSSGSRTTGCCPATPPPTRSRRRCVRSSRAARPWPCRSSSPRPVAPGTSTSRRTPSRSLSSTASSGSTPPPDPSRAVSSWSRPVRRAAGSPRAAGPS